MGISIKVKHTGTELKCENYRNWMDISRNCPTLEKIFLDAIDDNIAKYIVEHHDSRLRKLMSEIDKRYGYDFRVNVLDAVSSLAKDIRNTIHQSMSKKKNLEITCHWG